MAAVAVIEDAQLSGIRKSHALISALRRLRPTAGISQYKPPPCLARNVAPAIARRPEVAVLGANRWT
jgi:hypothetical protein